MTDTRDKPNYLWSEIWFLEEISEQIIASEWSFYQTIAAVVVVEAALYHYHAINSLEAHFETTVEKMLDEREQGSKAFINEAIKESKSNVLKRLLGS